MLEEEVKKRSVRHCPVLLISANALDFLPPTINAGSMLSESNTPAMRAGRICPIAGS